MSDGDAWEYYRRLEVHEYTKRRSWEYPDCPECGNDVYVSVSPQRDKDDVEDDIHKFVCHFCDVTFFWSDYTGMGVCEPNTF